MFCWNYAEVKCVLYCNGDQLIWKKNHTKKTPVFYDYDDVLTFLHQTKITPFSFLWLRWKPNYVPVISSREGPIEIQYDPLGETMSIYEHSKLRSTREGVTSRYILTTVGRVIFNQQIQQAIQEHIQYTKI